MDKVKVSIIVPVFNAEQYLDAALSSILDQAMSSYEVILVDDGSTDSSPLICDRYSATDPRFRTIHKSNGGVSSARNTGLNLAKGEYVMFVDSDDALLPDALERMLEDASGEDLVIGGYAVNTGGVPIGEIYPFRARTYREREMSSFFDDNIRRNCVMLDAPWAKLFRRKAISDLRFCEDLCYAEDKLFVFQFLTRCASARTCAVPVYDYHIRSGSLGSDVVSDRHLIQLRRFLPPYVKLLEVLKEKYPESQKIAKLYHNDVVSRYLCRILNIFLRRRTALLDKDYLGWVYGLIAADEPLGIFSVRPGQVFNLMLYKIGWVSASISIYRFISRIFSLFNA